MLFRSYLVALLGPLLVALAAQPVELVVTLSGVELPLEPAAGAPGLAVVTAVSAVALLTLAWTATWHGPAVLAAADVAWLLTSPLPRSAVLRPRLVRTFVRSAVVGALLGGFVGLLVGEVAGTGILLRGTVGLAAGGALAVLGQSATWWVMGATRRARGVLRGLAPALAVVVALSAVGLAAPQAAWALAWSGPWGWAALALVAPVPAMVGGGLLLTAATSAAAWWSLRIARTPPWEELARRADAGAGVSRALSLGDTQAARELARDATDALRGASRLRLPPPRRPGLAILWRDATVALRRPLQLGAGIVAAVAAGACAMWGFAALSDASGPASMVLVAVAGAWMAASLLLEALRSAIARPFGHLALPWTDRQLLWRHLGFPLVMLLLGGLAGLALAPLVTAAIAAAGVPVPAGVAATPTATGVAGLWLVMTVPPLVGLTTAAQLRPPPAPVALSTAMMTEGGALAQGAQQIVQVLPVLGALAGPAALAAGLVAAPAGGRVALLVLAAAWAVGGTAAAWLWTRSRSLPWQ